MRSTQLCLDITETRATELHEAAPVCEDSDADEAALAEEERVAPLQTKRKSPTGITTTNLTFSAYTATNADLFPRILALHVPEGSVIADVTYSKGIFWKNVPEGTYHVKPSDIKTGVDCRNLPYDDRSIDCVVLDPPYMEGLYRRSGTEMAGTGTYAPFRDTYSNGLPTIPIENRPKYHDAVVQFYIEAAQEALRVLKPFGVFIVKCQDEVSANIQRLTHVELINAYEKMGCYTKDLFVLVRVNRPSVSRIKKQNHARKNHSYFLVFIKADGKNPRGKGGNNGHS